ncbi:hypothetical protein TcBrA4_0017670 [Trypanosoma cruzi]|nr:hypothetical protein TcBrA4_0017670 [Trypanosoma cruzi]
MVFKGKDPNATFTSVADFEENHGARVICGGHCEEPRCSRVAAGMAASTWIHTATAQLPGRPEARGMLVCGPCTVVQAALARPPQHSAGAP